MEDDDYVPDPNDEMAPSAPAFEPWPGQETTATPPEGAIVRQGFGANEIQRQHETASTAMVAAAKAAIEARFIVAMRNPRNLAAVRSALLADCRRPSFAERAMYRIQRGSVKNAEGKWVPNFVEGPSIRFAEAARVAYRNLDTVIMPIYEDDRVRIVQVTTTDLEANITESGSVTVQKSVERKGGRDGRPPEGRIILGRRLNSYGDTVYIVEATADEVAERQNALTSKVKRNQILSMIPADLKSEAIDEARRTTVDATRKQLADQRRAAKLAFEKLGVSDDELTRYLGHPISDATADEIVGLRQVHNAIQEGSAKWRDILAQIEATRATTAAPGDVAEAKPAPTNGHDTPPRGNAGARELLKKQGV